MRREVRIAGFGGQGVGLAGYILGKALALYEGCQAVMTQSYGPEARGGASNASIVLSDMPIAYPFIEQPDYLISMSQEAYNKFHLSVKPEGCLIIDSDLVAPIEWSLVRPIRATNIAEELGARIVANMVILGFFAGVSNLVGLDPLMKAVETTVRADTVTINRAAIKIGYVRSRSLQRES